MKKYNNHQTWINKNNNKESTSQQHIQTQFNLHQELINKEMERHKNFNKKKNQRLRGKKHPPLVAQLDDISVNKEITLENNEDNEDKH
eukprot:5512834-Amphidinium_carterae.2